jgi:hypothetical protein
MILKRKQNRTTRNERTTFSQCPYAGNGRLKAKDHTLTVRMLQRYVSFIKNVRTFSSNPPYLFMKMSLPFHESVLTFSSDCLNVFEKTGLPHHPVGDFPCDRPCCDRLKYIPCSLPCMDCNGRINYSLRMIYLSGYCSNAN